MPPKTIKSHKSTSTAVEQAAETVQKKTPITRNNKSLVQSYAALPVSTRRKLSLGLMAFGLIGIVASDYLEKKMPPEAQN